MPQKDRSFEMRLTIDADIESVWRAISDAEELMKWFPPLAEVEPGEGGRIRFCWGEAVDGYCPIKAWKPNEHLQLGWFEPGGREEGELVVDFFLDKDAKGGTVLRLIHSGFGTDAGWDDEFDSISRGWNIELRSLKHYLEKHRGKPRRIAFIRIPAVDLNWENVFGPNGVFIAADPKNLEQGAVTQFKFPTGEQGRGEVLYNLPGSDFAATFDELQDGFFRLSLDACAGQMELWVWLASWELPQEKLESMLAAWQSRIHNALSHAAG
ncbi:MAG: SRPBCC domain-containing protein [Gammaproteobacteria bacterium]|nr:SRPBCC domain-containing protein [Gammaproteobacteria bacterium]